LSQEYYMLQKYSGQALVAAMGGWDQEDHSSRLA
jgi:hypothetical protein